MHLKTDEVDLKKATVKTIFCKFFQSTKVDMKNIAECYNHFFGYSNALETHGDHLPNMISVFWL